MAQRGDGVSRHVTLQLVVQPAASVTVQVYVPAAPTVMLGVVAPLLQA